MCKRKSPDKKRKEKKLVFLYRAFLLSGSVLSSTPYIGLLCLLRMHIINSCVGDT